MRRKVALLVGILLLGLIPVLAGASPPPRGVGRTALELDGKFVGWVSDARGGYAAGEVATDRLGVDSIQRKHIAGVKYEDIVVSVSTGMTHQFYDWIRSFVGGQSQRKNGAVVTADYGGRVMERLEFQDAIITEVDFPTLDAASKEPARMTVHISPYLTRRTFGKSAALPPIGRPLPWLRGYYRLRIDGLDSATARVNKIEALVIKQKQANGGINPGFVPEERPALELPNLVITLPSVQADPLYTWADSFIINGNNGDDQEKSGTLEFLSLDLQKVLFRLDFKHLGVFEVKPLPLSAGEALSRVTASMYVEEMAFTYQPGSPQ